MGAVDFAYWIPGQSNWYFPGTDKYLSGGTPNPRDDFVVGTTEPTLLNTGVIPGTILTTNTRTSFTGTAVEVFENMVFPNTIVLTGAKNKTFRNCKFEGRTGSSECVRAYDTNNENLVFEDCTFEQPAEMFPRGYAGTAGGKMGFRGHHVRLIRCQFRNLVDGFRPRRTGGGDADFQALGCYVADLLFLSPDTGQSNRQSHNDCIQDDQTAAQSNVLIDGCWLDSHLNPNLGQADFPVNPTGWATTADGTRLGGNLQYPWRTGNAVIQMASPTSGTKDNYVFTRNWMFGGSVLINAGGLHDVDLTVTNNRFGRDMRLGSDYGVLIPNTFTFTAFTGNTYYDNGATANIRKNG